MNKKICLLLISTLLLVSCFVNQPPIQEQPIKNLPIEKQVCSDSGRGKDYFTKCENKPFSPLLKSDFLKADETAIEIVSENLKDYSINIIVDRKEGDLNYREL